MKHQLRQREFGFVNWGGKRRGAGRKPKGERAGVPHVKRERLHARHPVQLTLRLCAGLPTLRATDTHALLKRAFELGSSESFRVIEYSVQSNHIHFLAESSDEQSLTRAMIGLTVRIARALNKLWRRVGSVFPDRFHARILKTPREVRNALVYVLQNARKHGAWRALLPDIFSSAPSFDGWTRNVALPSARLLSRARTWLLNVGWKKRGLIDPREAPAASR